MKKILFIALLLLYLKGFGQVSVFNGIYTGTGAGVRATSPTLTGTVTAPTIIGGSSTTSPLTLYATSGVAASGASVIFKGGTNGGTTFTTMNYLGNWDMGSGTITTTGNVSGNIGLFTSGVRAANNTKFYWNSGPIILGNTNDITLKNAASTAGANVSIGTSAAAASAILDVTSTAKGVLLPRMTSAQRDAISSPATGLTLFCTDCTATDASTGVMQTYNGSAWKNNW